MLPILNLNLLEKAINCFLALSCFQTARFYPPQPTLPINLPYRLGEVGPLPKALYRKEKKTFFPFPTSGKCALGMSFLLIPPQDTLRNPRHRNCISPFSGKKTPFFVPRPHFFSRLYIGKEGQGRGEGGGYQTSPSPPGMCGGAI